METVSDDAGSFRIAHMSSRQNVIADAVLTRKGSSQPGLLRRRSTVSVLDELEAPLAGLEEEHCTLGVGEVVSNLVNTVVGAGVISVPFAFRLSGYSCAMLLLLVIYITSQTAKMIGASLVLASQTKEGKRVAPEARDFAFLARIAFGPRTSWFIGIVTAMEIWFGLVTYMIMNGVNAAVVWPVNQRLVVGLSCLLAWLMSLLPMKVFSYVSFVSSLSLFIAGLAMICCAWGMVSWADPFAHTGLGAILQWQHIPQSVGIIIFCFAGHPCFPIVHESMTDRGLWNRSVDFAFFVAMVYYGSFGVLGYWVFGTSLQASFTENMARVPGALMWRDLAATAFMVKMQLTAPLFFNAVLVCFWPPRADKPTRFERVLPSMALTSVTALVALACAHEVAAVASLTGSACTMITSILFPAFVHARLAWQSGESKWCVAAWLPHVLVTLFGLVMGVSGTVMSVLDLIQQAS